MLVSQQPRQSGKTSRLVAQLIRDPRAHLIVFNRREWLNVVSKFRLDDEQRTRVHTLSSWQSDRIGRPDVDGAYVMIDELNHALENFLMMRVGEATMTPRCYQ